MSTYTYSQSLTKTGTVNTDRLSLEIQRTSIIYALDGIGLNLSSGEISIKFKSEITPAEKSILDDVISNHDGNNRKGIEQPLTTDRKPRVQIDPREGSSYNSPSINWCDKTTWFVTSTREENIELDVVPGTDDKTWKTPTDSVWVDVCHGKITGERNFREQYRPSVKIDGVLQEEKTPENLAGVYTADYRNGQITFDSSVDLNSMVEATFSCVHDSSWKIVPTPGKRLDIVAVEVQFSSDVELTDTIIFSVWGNVEHFAPHLVSETPNYQNSFPAGFKIPLKKYFYQTMDDLLTILKDLIVRFQNLEVMGGEG